MVNFKDLDITQLYKIVKIYNLETKIIPKGKKITKMTRDELADEIDKHLELKEDKIYYRNKTTNFDIPKKSPPRKEPDEDAPMRPKKPTKQEIIEQLKKRIDELEKTIEELKQTKENKKPILQSKKPAQPTIQYTKQKMKEVEKRELTPPPLKETPKRFEPTIDFEVVRKKLYSTAKKINIKQFIELLKNKKLMKEIKRIYESGDMLALMKLTTELIKKETDPEKRMELLRRHSLFNAFLSIYEKLSKNPKEKIKEEDII
jgi:hypothetical protein